MNGELAQTAALTAHAKARGIDARLGGDEAYWRGHSTLKYVRRLRFAARKRGLLRWGDEDIATTPSGWMTTLPRGAEINLVSLGSSGSMAPHIAVAFAGGTREGIAVSRDRENSLWVPKWSVVARYPETKIWSVQYSRALASAPPASLSIREATDRLEGAVRRIAEFAFAQGLSVWGETFERAAGSLGSAQPVAPYHPDILPPDGYSLAARRLLATAVGAFVFGGMGSWNDIGVADPEARARYERLTRELYAAVMDGLIAAVNRGIDAGPRR